MFVYILTNTHGNVLYVGVTNDLVRRLHEHKENKGGFANKYNCIILVYFERFENPKDAIDREKQIKRWSRTKKENLIVTLNPEWKDLSNDLG